MLAGYPPFFSEEPSQTCQKILKHKKYLKFPDDIKISDDAKDVLFRFICDPEERLGKNGVDEIKSHPFFKMINFDLLPTYKAPWIPNLKDYYDISNFDKFEEEKPWFEYSKDSFLERKKNKTDLNFVG
jgi:serine/threonine kinase 38